MSQLTIIHSILDKIITPSIVPLKTDAPILQVPYRAQVHHAPDGEKVRVSLPCARYGWWITPALFVIFFCPPAVYFAIVGGIRLDWRTGGVYWTGIPLAITLAGLLLVFYLLLRGCFPRIIIEATRAGVTIGKYKFDWEHTDGLRLGYTAGGKQRTLDQGPFAALRMGYGPWGFDLPYMVRNYYSAAYVVWLNMMLQTVEHVPQTERINSPEEGFKKDLF